MLSLFHNHALSHRLIELRLYLEPLQGTSYVLHLIKDKFLRITYLNSKLRAGDDK